MNLHQEDFINDENNENEKLEKIQEEYEQKTARENIIYQSYLETIKVAIQNEEIKTKRQIQQDIKTKKSSKELYYTPTKAEMQEIYDMIERYR